MFAYGQTASGKTFTMEGALKDKDMQGGYFNESSIFQASLFRSLSKHYVQEVKEDALNSLGIPFQSSKFKVYSEI